jgi:hypothetical protein
VPGIFPLVRRRLRAELPPQIEHPLARTLDRDDP